MRIGISVEQQQFADAIKRSNDLERKLGHRPVILSSRGMEAQYDPSQQSERAYRRLRVCQDDVDAGRAVAGDLGKFWWVNGYSLVGGDDVVPP